jgi:hypothetical protein
MNQSIYTKAAELLNNEDDGRVCRDISESACNQHPKSKAIHIFSLSLTKLADGLFDPKIILSTLLIMLGAPIYFIGFLVPIREAGALLPQLFTAVYIRKLPIRKYVWVIGSGLQGLSALLIAIAALITTGINFGYIVIVSLIIFSIARSLCSVSYKDVLGKTIEKRQRGTTTGLAGTVAASLLVFYAILITFGLTETKSMLIGAIAISALLWLVGAAIFYTLNEEAGETSGAGSPIKQVINNISLLKTDKQLLLFVTTRVLLLSTALVPPFYLTLLFGQASQDIQIVGYVLLAASIASLLSSYIWGRLADYSSRIVLMVTAIISFVVLILTYLYIANVQTYNNVILIGFLFALFVAYQGVRLGRSTHVVDMANEEQRANYTAISNTVVGLLLIVMSGFSWIANEYGIEAVILLFASMSAFAILTAFKLKHVQ